MKVLVSILATILALAVIIWSIADFIHKYRRKKEENKRIILYNRRTRQIKEVLGRNYVKTKSWEEVAITYEPMFTYFLVYLTGVRMITDTNNPKFMGIPSQGSSLLKQHFKEFARAYKEITRKV